MLSLLYKGDYVVWVVLLRTGENVEIKLSGDLVATDGLTLTDLQSYG